jgi:uncharacterized protein YegJ (DUF2314 family)
MNNWIIRSAVLTVALGGIGFAASRLHGQEDITVNVPTGDAAMVVAYGKARAGLDGFLAKLSRPAAGTNDYSVKVGLKDGPAPNGFSVVGASEGGEFFWIVNLRSTGNGYAGQIGNPPELVKNVKEGQTITFGRGDIVDWLYFDSGKLKGNFTACPALLQGPREQLEMMRKRYGLEC